ncbi:MAG: transporter [Woeseia sp.]|nr:transporter [Woeseia sp.]
MSIDLAVVIVYLIAITVLGISMARRVTSSASFFISDRSFGKAMMTFFAFGTGTNTDQAVSVASKTYSVGASGIWYQWLWLPATPFYWLLVPLFRRMRAVTTADYLSVRYGSSVAVLFGIVGIVQTSVTIGVVLKATSVMITPVSGGAIGSDTAIIGMTLLFVAYGVAGGLTAAIVTDAIQGVLTVVLSFLILPFALNLVGGMDGLRASISDPTVFDIVAPGEITLLYIVVIAINALVGWVAAPYSMAMVGAGKSESVARVGFVSGMLLKRVCTIAWVLTGMCAIALYAGTTVAPDHVYGLMARDLLPTIAPGLLGLFVACMLSAVMSSCDALMLSASALFTENIYKPLFQPNRDEKHYILVGRVASITAVVGGIFVAFGLSSVVQGLELFWQVQAMMGIAIWVSFFWRRATAAGAWASTIGGFAAFAFVNEISFIGWDFNSVFGSHLPAFMLYEGNISLPWQMIFYLTVSLVLMVSVSVLTRPRDEKILDRVYACLRTPVMPGEPEVTPVTLPETVIPAPRSVLIKHPDFEVMKPSRESIVGFIVTWLLVIALIGVFVWIIH